MKANRLAALVLLTLTGSCGPLVSLGNEGPPPALFTLPLGDLAAPEGVSPPGFASIRIEEMEPGSELRSERIAVSASDVGVQYLTGARWVDRPPVLLQRSLIDAFGRWGGITALGSTNLEVPADVRLTGRIDRFHLDVTAGQPQARMVVQVLLLKSRGGGILASRAFASSAPSASIAPDAVARAFSSAQRQLVSDIYAWVVTVKS